ncbi:MAG: mechanosensitive ion channel [Lentisphaerae bacterium]|nr:mechanosensitive ion channel [Lentisphaerota bacterium]
MHASPFRKLPAIVLCAGLLVGAGARGYAQSDTGAAVQSETTALTAVEPAASAPSVAAQTVGAVGQAAGELGDSLRSGGHSALEQGRKLWADALLPAVQRTAASVPMLLKGLLLLLAFWLGGRLAGGGVRRLLDLTRLDDRAVRDWGLEGLLKRGDGSMRSLSGLLGGCVKWILLLFGFVAFFNAINLTLVAAPLQRILDSIVGIIPQLLKATVILVVYWAIATLVRMALSRLLKGMKFDERAGKRLAVDGAPAGQAAPSEMLGRLAFYVILLFGLPPFLQALGQDALVSPLQDMLAKVLAFLPNLVAAGIIVLVGRIVASIVREFVANLLAATGLDARFQTLGFGQALGRHSLSSIVAQVVYFFILVPIIIAAVDSLGLKMIADPIKATLQSILAAVPALLVAAVVVIVGCLVAKVVRKLVTSFLAGVGLDALPERLGLGFLAAKPGQTPLSGVLGSIVSIVIILITAQQAAAALHFDQLADLVRRVIVYLPDLAVGLLIILATLSLGKYASTLITGALKGQGQARLLASIAQCAIILLGMGMALEQLGVGQEIVVVAVAAILGGAALALGLAFGLGGRDRAKDAIDRWSR